VARELASACVAIIGAASRSATWDPTFCSSIGSVGARWSCIASGRTRSCSEHRNAAIVRRRGGRARQNDLGQFWDTAIVTLRDIK